MSAPAFEELVALLIARGATEEDARAEAVQRVAEAVARRLDRETIGEASPVEPAGFVPRPVNGSTRRKRPHYNGPRR